MIRISLNFVCVVFLITASMVQASGQVIFRDDFTGTSLHPKWKLLAPDPDRYTLVDGDYLLIIMEAKGKNVLEFNENIQEDFVVVVKIDNPPQYENQYVRIVFGDRSGDNVRVGYHVWLKFGMAYFNKTLNGKVSQINHRLNDVIPTTDSLFLRLQKRGVEYFGAFSTDGASWTDIGVHALLKAGKRLFIDAYTRDDDAPESPIRLDFVEIRNLSR